MKYLIFLIWLSSGFCSQSFALTIQRVRQEDGPCTHAQVMIDAHTFQTREHTMILDIVTTSSSNIGAINFKETSDYAGCELVQLTENKLIIYQDLWAFLENPLRKYLSKNRGSECVFDHTYLEVTGVKDNSAMLHLSTRMRDARSLNLIQHVNMDLRVVLVNEEPTFFLGGERLDAAGKPTPDNIKTYELAPSKTDPK